MIEERKVYEIYKCIKEKHKKFNTFPLKLKIMKRNTNHISTIDT